MNDIKGPPLRTPPPPPPKEPEAMATNQIKITHHPATNTAREHWRSSDGKWSFEGKDWYPQVGRCIYAAFFNRILNAEPEPRRAKVGDRVRGKIVGEIIVGYVDDRGVKSTPYTKDYFAWHDQYTIVDPPQRLTAKGSDITQKDGVWEKKFGSGCSDSRFLVQNNKLIVKHDSFGSFVDPQKSPPASIVTYTHISDDPRDLTDWGAE